MTTAGTTVEAAAGAPLDAARGGSGLPAWPQAGDPALRGRYRLRPEDFRVEELPGWEADGEGEHLLVEVEKRGANTTWIAAQLAQACGVADSEIGWCGAKDRHAVTRQWFSVRDPDGRASPGSGGDDWQVLTTARHRRKLRRGEHAANRFLLRIELDAGAAPVDAALAGRIESRLAAGCPNYFGPQRFGRDGGNLLRARQWVQEGRLPRRGDARGHILSAARSLLFNEVLAARFDDDFAPLPGDVLEDGVPTGPLWGRGRSAVTGAAAEVEATALAPWQDWCARLEHVGLKQERRPLRIRPAGLRVEVDGEALILGFDLPPGVFATAVLSAIGTFRDAAERGDDGTPA
ncbi:MAG TPA: tRNA pseudouridine(13) synthase TruD [Pseudomonadales bacterium]|nr:tRNA pseudouridine(13) synthase TruD [Pseudomonadales bacterium]